MPEWSEAERLAALRAYDILDQPVADIFDGFVQIAAEICGTPIALISLVDEGRQWFAAETGLGAQQTPREVSVCAHAILQPGVFVVEDLTADPRFAGNILVTQDPNLRFYGGALLETPEGLPLGTVCVLDRKPRPAGLTDRQKTALQTLARQVMNELELRRALLRQAETAKAQTLLLAEKNALLDQLGAALAEKDLLMLEIHHRVKNSFAMVQGLLRLQSNVTSDTTAAQYLQESAGRIHIFASIHDHLYRVGAALSVDIAEYLHSLVTAQEGAAATALGRPIAFSADSIAWPAAEAPSLGLVLTELLTNALKYGQGEIQVTLRREGEDAVLTVSDEGTALAPAFDPGASQGLGMSLVNGILQGREGALTIDRSRGHTCFVARLRIPAPLA